VFGFTPFYGTDPAPDPGSPAKKKKFKKIKKYGGFF
jgi:hypothetical protein